MAKIQLQLNSIAFYIMWLLHNSFHIMFEKERNNAKTEIHTILVFKFRVSAIGQTNPIPLDEESRSKQATPETKTPILFVW